MRRPLWPERLRQDDVHPSAERPFPGILSRHPDRPLHGGGAGRGRGAIEAYVPQVGSVFQNPKTQYFNVDTTAELAFPCENAGMEPQAIRRRVDEVVEQFQLGPLMDRSVFKLSGGEKQRVAFAAAVCSARGCWCWTSRRATWTPPPSRSCTI